MRVAEQETDMAWFESDPGGWWPMADALSRFLKRYMGTDARRIVMSVNEDNGYEAWRRLHQQYEPATVTREAQVLNKYVHEHDYAPRQKPARDNGAHGRTRGTCTPSRGQNGQTQ